jgi:unsaturated rhamnogalacturonyl hydrolase
VMTRMYWLTGDSVYLTRLCQYFNYTKDQLFDEGSGLFYRDAKYIFPGHVTLTGKKDFWARGNGWVFAALARTLDGLPKSNAQYSGYITVFTKMAEALKSSQQEEGYWTRSILDEEQAPWPETSGTSFFTYGMLWGMNMGILERDKYAPVVEKSWKYLTETAIQGDSTLGYVQPIGENAMPGQVVYAQSTSDFGVGAFLLAAAEMVKYLEN